MGLASAHPAGIDLLITDIMLPGMSGPDLELELRKTHRAVRSLFMSGYTERLVLRRASLARYSIALHKPFSMKELTQAVRDHLDAE
jgi:two-component system cell cycle sensor histidine kinase/response regulator CckA